MTVVDWSIFDGLPENTCKCRCGAEFRSHSKAVFGGEDRGIHTRIPCPACGGTNTCVRSSTDPERMTYG